MSKAEVLKIADNIIEVIIAARITPEANCTFLEWVAQAKKTITDPEEFVRQYTARPEWSPYFSALGLAFVVHKPHDPKDKTTAIRQEIYAEHVVSAEAHTPKTMKVMTDLINNHGSKIHGKAQLKLKPWVDKHNRK